MVCELGIMFRNDTNHYHWRNTGYVAGKVNSQCIIPSQKYRLEDNIAKHYPQQIAILRERISGMEVDIQMAKENFPADKEQFIMKVGDKLYMEKKEAVGQGIIAVGGGFPARKIAAAMADQPAQRVSLREKLEAFKIQAAGAGRCGKSKGKDNSWF
ncbi:MAG: hypothetical protein Q4C91_13435 [Eubacteriales bacterium]|nr:hypothetical protein [Eubacteriales bacterium]